MSAYVLIPLLPLAACLILALSDRRFEGQGHRIAIPAIGASFVLSVGAFIEVLSNGPITVPLYRFIDTGTFVVDLGFFVDQLTVLLLLLVTGVSGVVHVYSSGYMIGDARHSRFFAVTSLFTFAMIMVVMSSNLLVTYIFWEIMGLCSYLLIAHSAQRAAAGKAATKAFLVNAVADVGLGFAVILTFATFGTLDIPEVLARAGSMAGQTINLLGWAGGDWPIEAVTLISLCMFMGVLGKSAQVPFHVWLPFAMEAPTPVSALIHAATMVNAGPFLLVRLSPLLIVSPVAMTVIAVMGATTALFGALVALTQSDIKKTLAYSTISQLGFMIMTCGVGAFVAASFHLLAHGFLKAFLFLSTGNALESVQAHEHGDAEPRPGSPSVAPVLAGTLLLACVPPLVIFSGPYESLWFSQGFVPARVAFWVIGLVTVFLTAMYLVRGALSAIESGPFGARPSLVSGPYFLPILAAATMLGAGLVTFWAWFARFLTPAVGRQLPLGEAVPAVTLSGAILLPLAVAIGGCGCAYLTHVTRRPSVLAQSQWMKSWYVHLLNKLYFDEIYEACIVRPTLRLAHWLSRIVDRRLDRGIVGAAGGTVSLARWLLRVVDLRLDRGVVGAGGRTVTLSGWLWEFFDTRGIGDNVDRLAYTVDGAGHALERGEPRELQHHLLILIVSLVAAIGLFYWLVQ